MIVGSETLPVALLVRAFGLSSPRTSTFFGFPANPLAVATLRATSFNVTWTRCIAFRALRPLLSRVALRAARGPALFVPAAYAVFAELCFKVGPFYNPRLSVRVVGLGDIPFSLKSFRQKRLM